MISSFLIHILDEIIVQKQQCNSIFDYSQNPQLNNTINTAIQDIEHLCMRGF